MALEFSEGMNGAALSRAGYEYIQEAADRMRLAGLPWLASILKEMSEEDPWQEGPYALKIILEWEKIRGGVD